MRSETFLIAAGLAAQALALPAGDDNGGGNYAESKKRANAVKDAFQTAWDGYSKYV